jgi:hypothetical protein
VNRCATQNQTFPGNLFSDAAKLPEIPRLEALTLGGINPAPEAGALHLRWYGMPEGMP